MKWFWTFSLIYALKTRNGETCIALDAEVISLWKDIYAKKGYERNLKINTRFEEVIEFDLNHFDHFRSITFHYRCKSNRNKNALESRLPINHIIDHEIMIKAPHSRLIFGDSQCLRF